MRPESFDPSFKMSAGDMQDEQLKEALITYEKLQAIEDSFEDVELEISKLFWYQVLEHQLLTMNSPSAGQAHQGPLRQAC